MLESLYEIPPGCICQGDGLYGMKCTATEHARRPALMDALKTALDAVRKCPICRDGRHPVPFTISSADGGVIAHWDPITKKCSNCAALRSKLAALDGGE